MQKVFEITNKYIILATPLILYSLFSSIYLIVSTSGGNLISLITAIILFSLMTAAFIAGWFNMIKIAITETEKDNYNSLIKEFPSGVGEFFLSSLGALFVMFLVFLLALMGSYFTGMHFIGDPNVSAESLTNALQNTEALKLFLSSLSMEQLTKINLWNMLILGTVIFVYFIFLLYLPALFLKNKNPFIAFLISLKDLFSKKIFKTISVFFLIFIVNFIISLLSTFFAGNIIGHSIITLLNFYYVTLVGVGVFYYYFHNFIAPTGQNIDIEI